MENADVLNQIRHSNNEAILRRGGARRGREREKEREKHERGLRKDEVPGRISLPTSRRDGSTAFRILAGEVRATVAPGFEKHQFPSSVSSAPCNVCISNFLPLHVALVTATGASKRESGGGREREREQESARDTAEER